MIKKHIPTIRLVKKKFGPNNSNLFELSLFEPSIFHIEMLWNPSMDEKSHMRKKKYWFTLRLQEVKYDEDYTFDDPDDTKQKLVFSSEEEAKDIYDTIIAQKKITKEQLDKLFLSNKSIISEVLYLSEGN